MKRPNNVFRLEDIPVQDEPAPPGFGAAWQPLPAMALLSGAVEVLEPGRAICPLHYHLHEEELLYVLEGEVTVRELAPDAGADAPYRDFPVRAGELIVWAAGTRIAHQTRNDGPVAARYLVLSDKAPQEIAVYPDSGKTSLRGVGVGVYTPRGQPARPASEVLAEAAARAAARRAIPVDGPERPSHVADATRVPERPLGPQRPYGRPLSRGAGAKTVFLNVDRLPPGAHTSPLHAHLADEELVCVVAGRPTVRQVAGRREGRRAVFDAPEERVQLRAGDWIHWRPGELVAHQLLNETDDDVMLLTIGTDLAHDLVIFPDRGEVLAAALVGSEVGRLEPTDYFAGEVAPTARAASANKPPA